jgi:DNA-binding transcriptional LysR family regulator
MPKAIDWESRIGRRLRLRDLHVFFAVERSGSMAKAAASLGVTQPAVSKAIADLEAALGVRLFDRGPQGVEPTMYGRALLKSGAAAFDELRQGIRSIEFLADPTVGELRIGAPESIAGSVLPAIIDRFAQLCPRVVLDAETGADTSALLTRMLNDRSLDLVLARSVRGRTADEFGEDFHKEILFDDELVVIAGSGHHLARRRKIDLADLLDERWMLTAPGTWNHNVVADAFSARGLTLPKIGMRTLSVHLRINLVAAGHFITAVPRSVLRLYGGAFALKVLPLDLPVRAWPVAMVTLRNRTLSPVAERFIVCARDVAKSMTQPNGGPAGLNASRAAAAGTASAPARR